MHKLQDTIRDWFYDCDWDEVYDFIEEISNIGKLVDGSGFRKDCNKVLKRELSGYRFVGEHLAPITNEQELTAIEEAMEKSSAGELNGVNEHLRAALAKLADRKEPDYRNSIKESISAVEALAKLISGDEKATLGKALRMLKEKIGLHEALEKGYSAIYGYTSDEDGIRHSMMKIPNCDLEDAQYMLISCSAFINYLIVKSQKAEIELS